MKKLSENLMLNFVSGNNWTYDKDDNEIITMFQISFTFYGKSYITYLSKDDIEEDNSSFSGIEGDSELFDSFEDQIQDEHWDEIVNACKAHVE